MELAEAWRAESYAAAAARLGIAVTAASAFAVTPGHAPNAVRLALASPPLQALENALKTLRQLAHSDPMPRPRYIGESERRSKPVDSSVKTGWPMRGTCSTGSPRRPPINCEILRSRASASLPRTGVEALLSPRSILEMAARLTPLFSESCSRVSFCSCRRRLSASPSFDSSATCGLGSVLPITTTLQGLARRWQESQCLRAAASLERATRHRLEKTRRPRPGKRLRVVGSGRQRCRVSAGGFHQRLSRRLPKLTGASISSVGVASSRHATCTDTKGPPIRSPRHGLR